MKANIETTVVVCRRSKQKIAILMDAELRTVELEMSTDQAKHLVKSLIKGLKILKVLQE